MIIALSNLLPIFIAFLMGYKISLLPIKININVVNLLSNSTLYLLLLLMGVTVGFIPDITGKLSEVGFNAVCIAISSSLFIAVTLKVFYGRSHVTKKCEVGDQRTTFNVASYIKDPLILGGLVILGFLFSYYNVIPNVNYDFTTSTLLYFLIFFIGIKLSTSGIKIGKIFLNKKNAYMTFLTIVSSYAGAAFVSLFIQLPLTQTLAISSGFGWYTLSGILFTKMDNALLGSVAFLCDLFREVIALLLIPTLSRIGNANIAIGVAGATAMDVTLPVIEKHCGVSYVPVALLSGGVITILVPFLIPFFYSL